MCGRFTLTKPTDTIVEHFELAGRADGNVEREDAFGFSPRFNIAPGQSVATVFVPSPGEPRRVAFRRWGLIPSWAKDPRIGNRQINARVETVATKPAFRAAFKRRRCIVPADGFYEWSGSPGAKQPYYIRRADGAVFGFAGLWEHWRDAEDQGVESCTLLTTQANDLLRELHARMPVILDRTHYEGWLDPDELGTDRLSVLGESSGSNELSFFPVSRRVNQTAYDDPSCVAPVEREQTLF